MLIITVADIAQQTTLIELEDYNFQYQKKLNFGAEIVENTIIWPFTANFDMYISKYRCFRGIWCFSQQKLLEVEVLAGTKEHYTI